MEPLNPKLNKNCECCGQAYGGGKNYGWEHSIVPAFARNQDGKITLIPRKGLCASCNPKGNEEWGNKWYIPELQCHKSNEFTQSTESNS